MVLYYPANVEKMWRQNGLSVETAAIKKAAMTGGPVEQVLKMSFEDNEISAMAFLRFASSLSLKINFEQFTLTIKK